MLSWIRELFPSLHTRVTHSAPVAAPNVFAIPELLQKILIFYGCDDAEVDSKGLVLHPSRGLYRLQRVNHTFRHNIADTKTLRQLMFLEVIENSDASIDKLQRQGPLLWFLQNLAHGTVDGSFGVPLRDYWLHVKGNLTSAGEISQRNPLVLPSWMEPEASWRKMKLMNTNPIILKSWFLNFHLKGEWASKTIECPSDSTLGLFFDTYLKLEAGITDGVARFDQKCRLCVAKREALEKEDVGPFILYQRKRLWSREDAEYRKRRDMELEKFFILQKRE